MPLDGGGAPPDTERAIPGPCELHENGRQTLARPCASRQNVKPSEPQFRTGKYRILKVVLWAGNHVLRWQLHHSLAPRAFTLLETVGRCTGQPRYTCVGNDLIRDTFWIVAAHGQQADWVRNISQQPRVRVLVNRCWRSGTPR